VLEKGAFGGQEHNSSADVLFKCVLTSEFPHSSM